MKFVWRLGGSASKKDCTGWPAAQIISDPGGRLFRQEFQVAGLLGRRSSKVTKVVGSRGLVQGREKTGKGPAKEAVQLD